MKKQGDTLLFSCDAEKLHVKGGALGVVNGCVFLIAPNRNGRKWRCKRCKGGSISRAAGIFPHVALENHRTVLPPYTPAGRPAARGRIYPVLP